MIRRSISPIDIKEIKNLVGFSAKASNIKLIPNIHSASSLQQEQQKLGAGNRNNTLASLAGKLRSLGADEISIAGVLRAANDELFDDPLAEHEVNSVAHSIASYPINNDPRLHDVGNAERLIQQFGHKLRYVNDFEKWIIWNGHFWQIDGVNQLTELAKQVAESIKVEANFALDLSAKAQINKHTMASHSQARLTAMIKLAQSILGIPITPKDLDRDDMLLCVKNGTINLKTGRLIPSPVEKLITRISPVTYDANAKCPRWLKFLDQTFAKNRELINYIQRVCGYCLTGKINEHVLFFLHGSGANGKTTFLNVFKSILGHSLAVQISYEAIMAHKNGRTSTAYEVAKLQGARVALTTEVEEGSRLAESLIKSITGGDSIAARHIYGSPFDFTPQFKLFIAGNHKPIIYGTDDGIWRRFHLIPFAHKVGKSKRDPCLQEKLQLEESGILNWAIEGCLQWQKTGLNPPKNILDAIEEYRSDSDVFGDWINECCETYANYKLKAKEAFDNYRFWAMNHNFSIMSMKSFCLKLGERGFARKKTSSGSIYLGIQLKLN